jgi:hypothetical protein
MSEPQGGISASRRCQESALPPESQPELPGALIAAPSVLQGGATNALLTLRHPMRKLP